MNNKNQSVAVCKPATFWFFYHMTTGVPGEKE